MVGAMAHPLNRPLYDEKKGRIVAGYGILQPRVAISLPGTNRSRYARMWGSDAGIDPYTRVVSDVYQDLFARARSSARASMKLTHSSGCLRPFPGEPDPEP